MVRARVSMLICSTSGSWRAAVMQAASVAELVALSHAGPIGGRDPVQRLEIWVVAFAWAAPMRALVVASLIGAQVEDGQSASVRQGALTKRPPAHCGRHTTDGG